MLELGVKRFGLRPQEHDSLSQCILKINIMAYYGTTKFMQGSTRFVILTHCFKYQILIFIKSIFCKDWQTSLSHLPTFIEDHRAQYNFPLSIRYSATSFVGILDTPYLFMCLGVWLRLLTLDIS